MGDTAVDQSTPARPCKPGERRPGRVDESGSARRIHRGRVWEPFEGSHVDVHAAGMSCSNRTSLSPSPATARKRLVHSIASGFDFT
jgi:hypothetical protein